MSDYTYRITPVGGPTPRAIDMTGPGVGPTMVYRGGLVYPTFTARRYTVGALAERRAKTLKPSQHSRVAWAALLWGLLGWSARQPPKEGAPVEFYTVERSSGRPKQRRKAQKGRA